MNLLDFFKSKKSKVDTTTNTINTQISPKDLATQRGEPWIQV